MYNDAGYVDNDNSLADPASKFIDNSKHAVFVVQQDNSSCDGHHVVVHVCALDQQHTSVLTGL